MKRLARSSFLAVSLGVVATLLIGTFRANAKGEEGEGGDSTNKYLSVFMEVLSLTSKAYVDEPKTASLMAGAFEGSIDALDPFSLYIPAESVAGYLENREVGSRHSGMLLLKERGVAYVVAVAPGSPAAKVGLEPGDILSEIGGIKTRETPLYALYTQLGAKAGTKLSCERLRFGEKARFELELGEYPPPAVEVAVARGVPVLKLGAFHAGTVADVERSLENLKIPSATLPDLSEQGKLILDLRAIAGGDERVAYRVAALFARGELGALYKRKKQLEAFKSDAEPRWQGQIFLLVDRGTQGAAEVLATVLRQNAGAKLVGERSFGHAGLTELIAMADGSRLQLTTAFFAGPDGKLLTEGLEADERVARTFEAAPEEGEEPAVPTDDILERALDVLLGKTAAVPAIA